MKYSLFACKLNYKSICGMGKEAVVERNDEGGENSYGAFAFCADDLAACRASQCRGQHPGSIPRLRLRPSSAATTPVAPAVAVRLEVQELPREVGELR